MQNNLVKVPIILGAIDFNLHCSTELDIMLYQNIGLQ